MHMKLVVVIIGIYQGKNASGTVVDMRIASTADANSGDIFTYSNHDLGFATNNAAPQMILKTSGIVGIGTALPASSLSVIGAFTYGYASGYQTNSIRISTGAYAETYWQLDNQGSGFNSVINLVSNGAAITTLDDSSHLPSTGMTPTLNIWNNGTSPSKYLQLFHDGTNGRICTSSGDLALLPSSGNVGIGTTSPNDVLEVHGDSGQLLEAADDFSDVIFSANTISGLPVIEACCDNTVTLGKYNRCDFVIQGSTGYIGVGTNSPVYPVEICRTIS